MSILKELQDFIDEYINFDFKNPDDDSDEILNTFDLLKDRMENIEVEFNFDEDEPEIDTYDDIEFVVKIEDLYEFKNVEDFVKQEIETVLDKRIFSFDEYGDKEIVIKPFVKLIKKINEKEGVFTVEWDVVK